MRETLWISLPEQEANALQEIINLISSKQLIDLSVKQLIRKLESDQADDWIEILGKYNAISSARNLDTSEMLNRTKSVRREFRKRGYEQLENREFQPNKLIGLVILCYSNPNLIGPNLCRALNENNTDNIKKEIAENSAYVRSQGRVVPWASNLRLLNYALYANDTSVRLPEGVRDRIRQGAEQKGISLNEIGDHRTDIQFINNGSYLPLQSIASYGDNQLIGEPSSVSNGASGSQSPRLIGSLAFFYLARNTPIVGAVVRNIGKDLRNAVSHFGNFFSKDNIRLLDQIEEKTVLLPSVPKL